MQVRATELIDDEGRVFAEPNEVGEVFGADTYEDGTQALTVLFPRAPCVTTVFLGINVEAMN